MNKITHALAFGAFARITTEFGIIGILPQISAHFQVDIVVLSGVGTCNTMQGSL